MHVQVHISIRCDVCGMNPIQGARFKCINCVDYDLCRSCHSQHSMAALSASSPDFHFLGRNPFVHHPLSHVFLHLEVPLAQGFRLEYPLVSDIFYQQSGGGSVSSEMTDSVVPQFLGISPKVARSNMTLGLLSQMVSIQVQQPLFTLGCDVSIEMRNVALSPFSLWIVLAMAAAGARSGTLVHEGLLKELGCCNSEAVMAQRRPHQILLDSAAAVLNDLHKAQNAMRQGALSIANAVVLIDPTRSTLEPAALLSQEYQQICRASFESSFFSVSSAGDPQHLVDTVNSWCHTQTRGKISTILNAPPPPRDDIGIILLNAIYLKAKWETPFNRLLTSTSLPFYPQGYAVPSVYYNCEMMSRTGRFAYVETETLQAIRIPYAMIDLVPSTQRLSAFIIVPKPHISLPDLIACFSQSSTASTSSLLSLYTHLASQSSHTNLKLQLPKFKAETDQADMDLTKFLSCHPHLVPSFLPDPDVAPFSDMLSTQSLRGRNLHISSVIQKVFVQVDEAGTEAAAVTAVMMGFGGVGHTQLEVSVKVDRPFLFSVGLETQDAVDTIFLAAVFDVANKA
ncbi:hypothetical protein HDU67_006923 [Dinochytrium kinnereticum]|nr:hypothetical protein HDU67_006923 [Dinochytrium kinnereticum]